VIDEVVSGRGSRVSPGGVPTYAGLAVASLGHEPLAASCIGGDGSWLLDRLRRLGVNVAHVRVLEHERTTRFRIVEGGGGRVMWVSARCADISVDQLEFKADAVYLGPVVGEFSEELVSAAVREFGLVALDPQGLMRVLGPDGRVSLRPIPLEPLRGVSLLRLSEEEFRVLGFQSPREASARISGALGCDVLASSVSEGVWVCGGGVMLYGRVEVGDVADSVGAGDVAGGAYTVGILEEGDRAYALALAIAAVRERLRAYGPVRLDDAAVRRAAEEVLPTIRVHGP